MAKETQWEYKTVYPKAFSGSEPAILRKLGKDGWEVVSIKWDASSMDTIVLKRKKTAQ